MIYKVIIKELLEKELYVEVTDAKDPYHAIHDAYSDGLDDFVLTADNFVEHDIAISEAASDAPVDVQL